MARGAAPSQVSQTAGNRGGNAPPRANAMALAQARRRRAPPSSGGGSGRQAQLRTPVLNFYSHESQGMTWCVGSCIQLHRCLESGRDPAGGAATCACCCSPAQPSPAQTRPDQTRPAQTSADQPLEPPIPSHTRTQTSQAHTNTNTNTITSTITQRSMDCRHDHHGLHCVSAHPALHQQDSVLSAPCHPAMTPSTRFSNGTLAFIHTLVHVTLFLL